MDCQMEVIKRRWTIIYVEIVNEYLIENKNEGFAFL